MLRYEELLILRNQENRARAGENAVRFFLRQVPFHLPGGVKYLADFLVFWSDGRVTVEDVKAKGRFRTEMYRTKKKLVESIYPVTITEPE